MKTLKFVIQSLASGVHNSGEYASKGYNGTIGWVSVCHLGSSGIKFDTKDDAVDFFKNNILPNYKGNRFFAVRTLDTSKCGRCMNFEQLIDEPIVYIS